VLSSLASVMSLGLYTMDPAGVLPGGAKYQISGTKNQSLTGYPGDFRFMTRRKIKLASQISQW